MRRFLGAAHVERFTLNVLAAAAVALTALPASALAAPAAGWQVERGQVRVVCPLTVGGAFDARTSAIEGALRLTARDPVSLTGSLAVDLRTLDTGIALRNEHLRNRYLETSRGGGFEVAELAELRLEDADAESFEGRTSFTGTLRLHGVQRAIAGRANIRREASLLRVEAEFALDLAAFGIEKPQYLGVGVKNEVQVKVSLTAASAPR